MEIFDRYIREVIRHLPRGQRDDVAKELRSTLEDSLDGRMAGEADGGGADAAAMDLLRDFGPPRELAASYRTGTQYLIGPGLYPGFLSTLKVCLLVVCGLQVVVGLFGLSGPSRGFGRLGLEVMALFSELQGTALGLLGLIVFIFWLIQRLSPEDANGVSGRAAVRDVPGERSWNPADLPPLKDPDRVDRGGEILGVVFMSIALLVFNFHSDKFGAFVSLEGDGQFVPLLGPAFRQYLPWWNVYLVGAVVTGLLLLARNRWTPALRGLDLGLALLLVAVLWWMLHGEPLLQPELAWPEGPGADPDTVERFEEVVTPAMRVIVQVGLWIWLAVAGYSAVAKIVKLARRTIGAG